MSSLRRFGWREVAEPPDDVGRIVDDRGIRYSIVSNAAELDIGCHPKFLKEVKKGLAMRPVVGDWVRFSRESGDLFVVELLPRTSVLRRKAAGLEAKEQTVVANIDRMVIVTSLETAEFSIKRLQRYFALAREGNVEPWVIVNKTDLATAAEQQAAAALLRAEIEPAHVVWISAHRSDDEELARVLGLVVPDGLTVVFTGSSGVGKSSLVNRLLGNTSQSIGDVQRDGTGRHTTTMRAMFSLPSGGLLIDTPGLREVGLWSDNDGLRETFADVDALAMQCQFGDCTHTREPGCRVQIAVRDHELDAGRYSAYVKLRREVRDLGERRTEASRRGARRDSVRSLRSKKTPND